MLCPAGVLGPAPGVKAQAAHGHGLVLGFFRALRFNEDGLRALLVVRQGGQQSGSDAVRFAVQDHAQGLQLSGRKIPAHLVQVNVRQLFGGQQPPGQVLGVHTIRVPFW